MRIFVAVLLLIFSFQFIAKADDIRDFQIEGMSIGDSLLDYFSAKEIRKSLVRNYKSDKYKTAEFLNLKSFKKYDSLNINFLKKDNKKTIYAIHGMKDYNNIDNCLNDKKDISSEIEDLFNNVSIDENDKKKHVGDKSGKSFTYDFYITLQNKDLISVSCYDWSKKSGYQDHLRISIVEKKFLDWINNEAYK
jgi:hypothetical protein